MRIPLFPEVPNRCGPAMLRAAMMGLALWTATPTALPNAPVVAKVVVTGTVLSDNGDDDGWADTNETVTMRLRVRNLMSRNVDNLVATLDTDDQLIECITRSSLHIGNLAAGEERITEQAFEFKVADVNRTDVADDLSVILVVRVLSDDLDHALNPEQPLTLDLDLNVAGGDGPTTFFEGFEGGFGTFTTMHLDEPLNPPASDLSNFEAGVINADGFRCQYSDPEWEGSNSFGHSQGEQCFPNPNEFPDWFFFGVTTDRAYSGEAAMHFGFVLDVARGSTTPIAQLEAITNAQPIHLGWDSTCSASTSTTCRQDLACPPGEVCTRRTPTLIIKHQVDLIDHRTLNGGGIQGSWDRGIVQVQLAGPDGTPQGDWMKITPFQNAYDTQPIFTRINCFFDPTDDGDTEADFFDPADPNRRFGPSSTCYPEYNFVHQGSTVGLFDPMATGDATHGPGLAGEKGEGTWIDSRFNLERFRGRSIRVRFLTASVKVGADVTWEQALHINPYQGDDGWFVDDVTVTDTLAAAASVTVDGADNGQLPGLVDDDEDGLTCGQGPARATTRVGPVSVDGSSLRRPPVPVNAPRSIRNVRPMRQAAPYTGLNRK